MERRLQSGSGTIDGMGTVSDRVVDGQDDRLAVGADAESVRALAVLDGDGCRNSQFRLHIAAAVGALVDEVHGLSFLSRANRWRGLTFSRYEVYVSAMRGP
jgi:hypothetical protein